MSRYRLSLADTGDMSDVAGAASTEQAEVLAARLYRRADATQQAGYRLMEAVDAAAGEGVDYTATLERAAVLLAQAVGYRQMAQYLDERARDR